MTLPVAELAGLDRKAPAIIRRALSRVGDSGIPAQPAVAPPTANPFTETVDAYYELVNADGSLVPGQRVAAAIPLAEAAESASVPWSAITIDFNGGTWIYEKIGPQKYVRRRVTVHHTAGTDAALASGPAVGTTVVAHGAQELFGAETGFVK